MNKDLEKVGLSQVINDSIKYFCFEENKNKVLALKFFKNENELKKEFALLYRMQEIVEQRHRFSFSQLSNLYPVFKKISNRICLNLDEFALILPFFKMNEEIFKQTRFFENELDDDFKNNVLDLVSFSSILNKLNSTFSFEGPSDGTFSYDNKFVLSSASDKLHEIRKNIESKKRSIDKVFNSVKEKYSDYLSEENSFKDGYQTLSVKSNFINKVEGVILQRSNTSRTLFVLPKELILIENELNDLYVLEANEIFRILQNLTDILSEKIEIIRHSYDVLKFLDFYYAKTNYMLDNDFSVPQVEQNKIELNSLFHPFLDKKTLVKNSFSIDKNKNNVLVLSGPNAGGKSVLFKSIAICFYLFMIGFPVNCSKQSKLYMIDKIFLSLSDDESINDNLSKFTSHLTKLNTIVSYSTDKSLVLIDEICAGTSPKEGEALGISFITELSSINCFSFISTHYDSIKKFALTQKNYINATMEFDSINLKPTYKLLMNKEGNSYAMEACYKVGVNKKIVDRARKILLEKQTHTQKLEYKLTKQIDKYSSLLKKIEEKEKELEKLNSKKQKVYVRMKEKEEEIENNANVKIKQILDEKISILEDKYRLGEIELNEYAQLKGNMQHEKERLDINKIKIISTKTKIDQRHDLKVGDYVVYDGLSKCRIVDINKNKVSLNINGMIIKTTLNKVEYDANNSNKVVGNASKYSSSVDTKLLQTKLFKNEINLIGLTSDEAIKELESFISECLIRKIHFARIIHGMGSFILKTAVAKYLEKSEFVDSFRDGNENEGSMGATIVYFK